MKRFDVIVQARYSFTVEADSEADAEDIAFEKWGDEYFDWVEFIKVTEIEETE